MKMALVEFPKKCRSNAGQRPIPSAPAYRHTVQFHPSPFSYQALLFNFMRVWFQDKAWSSNATIYWEAGVCLILQVINIPFHKVTGYFLWEEWEEENNTIVSQKSTHGWSTLQVCQRKGWVLFWVLLRLATKEHPCDVVYVPLKQIVGQTTMQPPPVSKSSPDSRQTWII